MATAGVASAVMGYISIGAEKLYYDQIGTGKRILLAFHGYGENAASFAIFEQYTALHYTLLSFDLPHHGNSIWPRDMPFTTSALLALIAAVQKEYGTDKISLIGNSLGCRICLTLLELAPAHIDKIVLLAADGIAINNYYYFFTRTAVGKMLFRHMLTRPRAYLGILNILKRLKIIDTSQYKFVMNSLQSPQSRMFLLQVWPCLSGLIPHPLKIKAAINQYQVPVTIFMGAYDRIMPPGIASKFASGMATVSVEVVPQGHRILNNETIEQIASKLL